jgi:hypothetical protein
VLVGPAPKAQTPSTACSRGRTLRSCVTIDGEERATYDTIHAFARTSGFDTCPRYGGSAPAASAPPLSGNVVAYRDTDHLSATYSRLLAGPFARLLAARMEPLTAG